LGGASKASDYTPVAFSGALPHTPSQGKEHCMKKQKDKTYAFRISSVDLKKIKAKAKRANLTVTDYLTACALDKEITVIDSLDSVLSELKAQGRNLNQLTVLSHQGRSYPSQIQKLTDAYGDICALLKKILEVV
jgi:hypothetical protein